MWLTPLVMIWDRIPPLSATYRLKYHSSLLVRAPASFIKLLIQQQLIQNAAACLVFILPMFSHTAPAVYCLTAAFPSSSNLWCWPTGTWREVLHPTSKPWSNPTPHYEAAHLSKDHSLLWSYCGGTSFLLRSTQSSECQLPPPFQTTARNAMLLLVYISLKNTCTAALNKLLVWKRGICNFFFYII